MTLKTAVYQTRYMADSKISTLECGLEKLRIRVDGSRIQKEIVADSVISGLLRTGPMSLWSLSYYREL